MNNRQRRPQPDTDTQPDTGPRQAAEKPRTEDPPRAAHPPTDTRRARRRQERQLLALVIGVLIFVGGTLIALIYGPGALLTAIPCLLAGAGAILFLYLLFLLAERWVSR